MGVVQATATELWGFYLGKGPLAPTLDPWPTFVLSHALLDPSFNHSCLL